MPIPVSVPVHSQQADRSPKYQTPILHAVNAAFHYCL